MRPNNILCVNERTWGEANSYRIYTHYFTFPDMKWIKREYGYYDPNWTYPGIDSGESAFLSGNMYTVNCYGRNILKFHDGFTPAFIEEIVGANTAYPDGYDSTTFRPVGITFKDGNWFVLSGGNNTLLKFSQDWEFIRSVSCDTSTYDEHDGLVVAPNGNLIAGTKTGHLVEFDESCEYSGAHLIDSNYQYRGAAIWNGYIVTARIWDNTIDEPDHFVTILSYPDYKVVKNFDMTPYLNTSTNATYGTFFLN